MTITESTELKPCPFCGGEAKLTILGGRHGWVECRKFGAETSLESTLGSAAAVWNQRVNADDQTE